MQTNIDVAKIKMDESPVVNNMPTGLVFIPNQTNRKLLAAAWRASGLAPRWPVDTRSVMAILTICGYDASRKTLDYHLRKEYFPLPAKQNIQGHSQFAWQEGDVIAFADSLERTRNLLPCHAVHIHKLNPRELAKAYRIADARNAAIQAFDAMTTPDLIHLLVVTDSGETRQLLAMILSKKLGLIHVKGDEANAEDN